MIYLKKGLITGLAFLLHYSSVGQNAFPPVCTPPAKMESTCAEACIICDIDGFTGRNNSTIQGEAPPGFCTTQVHHMQWIGFVAASTTLKVSVTVSNCTNNDGLEVGFYKGIDCDNFQKITFCDTDIQPGETATFTNTTPLEIGQYYYIVMDGSNNDICDWTFKVLEGSTKLGALNDKALINAPDTVCSGALFNISTPGVIGGTDYLWRMNGDIINSGKEIEHNIMEPGEYTICVTPRNVCQIGIENCKKITVMPVSASSINIDICERECYTWYGNVYCTSGDYPVTLKNKYGCDSIVTLKLTVKQIIDEERTLSLCQGDTLAIEQYKLFSSGTYPLKLINADGCEITLTIKLTVVDCSIKMDVAGDSLQCYNDKTGQIIFKVVNGIAPFTFEVHQLENESIVYTGSLAQVNESVVIPGLSAGTYAGTIMDNFGRTSYFYQYIAQPKPLKLDYVTSDYNGVNVKCKGDKNGFINLLPSGGTGFIQLTYQGQNIAKDALKSLAAGSYIITFTDRNQCSKTDTIVLTEPDPIVPVYQIIDAGCEGPQTGSIIFEGSQGGTKPIVMTADNALVMPSITKLGAGIYDLVFTDVNGCTKAIEDTLYAAQIPKLTADSILLNTNLGDSLYLYVNDTIVSKSYHWTALHRFSCDTCLITSTLPLSNSFMQVVAISEDGCRDSLMFQVKVNKPRSFVLSNIMVMSSITGNNDARYYAGKDVSLIKSLTIYDRWGGKMYNTKNLENGTHAINWKGWFNGRQVATGVYTWIAEVAYIDNVVIFHKGSLTIID